MAEKRLSQMIETYMGTDYHPVDPGNPTQDWALMIKILNTCAFPEGFCKRDARCLAVRLECHRAEGLL